MSAEAPADLRRLGFVATYSESIFGSTFKIADSLYRTTRAHTPLPGFVDARVKVAEDKFSELSVPLLNFVQDRASQLLTIVDVKVDQGVGLASDLVNQSFGIVHFPQKFQGTRDAYVARATELVTLARQQTLSGTYQAVKEQTVIVYDSAKRVPVLLFSTSQELLNKVNAALVSLRESMSVEKAIGAVAPTVDLAKQKYIQAHDAIVAAPVYKQAYETSTVVISKVQTTPLYQNVYAVSANRLYPAISPYATPLVEKAQPYIDSVFEQLKPITAAA